MYHMKEKKNDMHYVLEDKTQQVAMESFASNVN